MAMKQGGNLLNKTVANMLSMSHSALSLDDSMYDFAQQLGSDSFISPPPTVRGQLASDMPGL